MRGSYEFAHNADIEIHVVNGIATTFKNRFLEKRKQFSIFDEKLPVAKLKPPDNVFRG